MARPSRSAMYADDATFLWKAILRFLAILLAIIGIGTTAWVMTTQPPNPSSNADLSGRDDYDYMYSDSNTIYFPWQFIALGLSILWNVANISALLLRNRAIHPGANVACDLLLWLALLATGFFATIGATSHLYYNPAADYSYDGDSGYAVGTYANGTQYEFTSNGTTIPVTNGTIQCGAFTSCAARDQYVNAIQHRGAVAAVGASMAFIVLLFHFALFISACRYTNARRQSVTGKHTKAITAEATGPNGGFIPRNQAQQFGEYQSLKSSDAGEAIELRQQQSRAAPGHGHQPVLQGEMGNSQGEALSREEGMQRRYDQAAPGSSNGESTLAAGRGGKERADTVSDEGLHPALRDD